MASNNYRPTPHLLRKMQDRAVTWGEILDVIDQAETRFGPDREGRTVHQKGSLTVVTTMDGGVVTVLLRQESQWNDQDAINRERAERERFCDFHDCPGYDTVNSKAYYTNHKMHLHVRCEMRLNMEGKQNG